MCKSCNNHSQLIKHQIKMKKPDFYKESVIKDELAVV